MPSNTLANLLVSDRADSIVVTDDGLTFGQFKADISRAMASHQPKLRLGSYCLSQIPIVSWFGFLRHGN